MPVALFVPTRGAELVDVASADTLLRTFSTLDSQRFLAAARLIAGGDVWCGKAAFEFAPLYAYCLAPFQLLGLGVGWVHASQLVLGALGAWLVYRIGAADFGKHVAVCASSLWCLYGPARFLEFNRGSSSAAPRS